MDHKQTRRSIGVLARFHSSSWSTLTAMSLTDAANEPQVLLLCDRDQIEANKVQSENSNIRPCWSFSSNDLSELESAVARESISVIHVTDPWLLTEWAIAVPFLEAFRKQGGITSVSLPFPQRRFHDPELMARCFDQILVATEQDRIWLLGNGIAFDHLVLVPAPGPKIAAPANSGNSADPRRVVIVASHQLENQVTDLLRNLHEIESGVRRLNLTILASAAEVEKNANHYNRLRSAIERTAAEAGTVNLTVAGSNNELTAALAGADIVITPDWGGSAEQLGAVNCALAAPGAIITTGLRSVVEAGAALLSSSEDPLWRLIRLVFDREDLRDLLLEGASRWRALVGPNAGREGTLRLFTGLAGASAKSNAVRPVQVPVASTVPLAAAEKAAAVAETAKPAATSNDSRLSAVARAIAALSPAPSPASVSISAAPATAKSGPAAGLRVLMQNRPNMLTQRGGDTVVVEQLTEKLREFGAAVDIDLEGKADPRNYDVVHLHNFAIREVTENFARKAVEAGTPYVVTTLYEDWPRFFNQMMATYSALDLYVQHGQPRDRWNDLMRAIEGVPPSVCWDNTFAATHAASLLVSGANEAVALRRDYNPIKRIDVHNFGCPVTEASDGGELFTRQTGLKDFVLCVGRLETRKNQLMLLRALEDSDLTLVFAAGGFTYQHEYADACRKFRRRGKTVFLDRLDAKQLASAYGACRVHALPSWYELPGLVSIEAALHGAAVVATDYGTARDYLGNFAHYCQPNHPESIRKAIETAMQIPIDSSFKEHVKSFTWEACARQVLNIYQQVVSGQSRGAESVMEEIAPIHTVVSLRNAQIMTDQAQQSVASLQQSIPSMPVPIDAECLETDKLVRNGQFDEAEAIYERLIREDRSPAAASRGLGVIELLRKNPKDAEDFFRQALGFDPSDFRAMAGLGTSLWAQGRREEGFAAIVKASDGSPDDQSIVLQMINPSYALNRLEQLQAALERFVRKHPDNLDMCYCLAGCYFRRKRLGQAEAMLHRILMISPTHPGGLELRALMHKEQAEETDSQQTTLASSVVSERITAGIGSQTPIAPAIHGLPGKPPEINVDQLAFRAEQAKKAHDYEQAISVANSILDRTDATENQRALAWIVLGESLACKGDLAAGEAELHKAEGNLAHGYRALSGLGAIAAANEKYDDAERMFRRSLSLVRENDNALAGLGICAMKSNNAQDGWDYFKKALEVNPENMRAICGLIQLANPLNKLAELERALETYLEFRPVDLSVLFSYAGCLFAQGKSTLASEQLRKILVFDPEHKMANELLRQIGEQPAGSARPSATF